MRLAVLALVLGCARRRLPAEAATPSRVDVVRPSGITTWSSSSPFTSRTAVTCTPPPNWTTPSSARRTSTPLAALAIVGHGVWHGDIHGHGGAAALFMGATVC